MEIMITIVIIGILAALAIPNYSRMVEIAHRNDATTNLMAIHAAEAAYRSEHGEFWPPVGSPQQNLVSINSNLGLEIAANGFAYTCDVGYVCIAWRSGAPGTVNPYAVIVTSNPIQPPNTNPICIPNTPPCSIN